MISERWWLMGAFAVALAGASISTWATAGPRVELTASAASRHRTPAQRAETVDPLLVSASPPPSPVASARPSRRARAPTPEPEVVSIDVPDLPEPPPQIPLLWDDLFPAAPRQADGTPARVAAPCFDRLQGIRGASPCPAVTPR
jgi:hypothetical protein